MLLEEDSNRVDRLFFIFKGMRENGSKEKLGGVRMKNARTMHKLTRRFSIDTAKMTPCQNGKRVAVQLSRGGGLVLQYEIPTVR